MTSQQENPKTSKAKTKLAQRDMIQDWHFFKKPYNNTVSKTFLHTIFMPITNFRQHFLLLPYFQHGIHFTHFWDIEEFALVYASSKPDVLVPHLLLARVATWSKSAFPSKILLLKNYENTIISIQRSKSRFTAVGSILAHFTTLGAWKYMYGTFIICINFIPCWKMRHWNFWIGVSTYFYRHHWTSRTHCFVANFLW